MSACIEAESLGRWLEGTLPAEEAEIVARHVVDCHGCQASLDRKTENVELRKWLESLPCSRVADDDRVLADLLARLRVAPPERVAGPSDPESAARPISRSTDGPGAAVDTLGTFELRGELGRGGMGIVHRAWDRALRREVAIKILRPELSGPAHRRRLVREAQHAARFRHDHAVLIHSVVDPPAGFPCLVMEYVEGSTLAELISAKARAPIRDVATWISQVASALHAAHEVGMIHRDVKPGNILIDERTSRAKIADFGLARTAGGATVTRECWAGTPTYMSPEQARGDPHLDPRTDIYSLGATLYEALTGIPPYQGESHLVLRQIIEEDPRPLRQLNDAVPRDLETICLKAMDREPARRYATAAALAEDLGRWLRGESIEARPAGRPERLYRWSRRNPWIAGLSVALLAVVVVGFAGVVWQWRRAERNARRADLLRQQAEDNLGEARAGFQQARHAVDQFYTRFYEEGVLKVPGLEKVRHDVLAEMLQYYKDFVARHRDDPSLRMELAEACLRIGRLTFEQGDPTDALTLHRRALAEFEQLAGTRRDDPAVLGQILICLNNIGLLQERLGDRASARHTYERGIETLRTLIRKEPDNRTHKRRLAAMSGNLASLFFREEDHSRARDAYRIALENHEELVRLEPASVTYLNDLGMTYNNIAVTSKDEDEARSLYRKALEIRERIVQREPTAAYYRRNLARTYGNLGATLDYHGKHEEAAKPMEEARRLLEQVVIDQPAVPDYQAELAQALENLGNNLGARRQYDAGRERLQRAASIYRKVLHGSPGETKYKSSLSRVEKNLADLEEDARKSKASPRGTPAGPKDVPRPHAAGTP